MTKLREKFFLYVGGGGIFHNAKIDWAHFEMGLPLPARGQFGDDVGVGVE